MPELPKIVTQRLQTKATDQGHPDPELITAFVENSLPQRERNQVLEHFARCGDCREIVSFSLPEYPVAISASARPAGSPWLSWPVLRWGAVAACLVIVGAAVMLRHESRSKSEEIIAWKAPEARTRNENAAAPEPDHMQAQNQVATQPSQAAHDALSGTPSARLRVKKVPATAINDKELSTQVAGELRSQVAQANSAAGEATPSAPSSAMDELVPGRAKDVPLEARAANATGGPRVQAKTSMAASAMSKTAYPSAALVPRWTLTSDGILQRSLDSGATWETVPVPGQPTLRALAADGLDIWVGGSNGALYHSSDAGQHWTQVRPIANSELLSADIIGVEFTDLQHGTVTTSAKETWVTADAGQTWLKK